MPLTAGLYPCGFQRVLHLFDVINRVFCTKIGQLITEYRLISYFTPHRPLVLNNTSLADIFVRRLQDRAETTSEPPDNIKQGCFSQALYFKAEEGP